VVKKNRDLRLIHDMKAVSAEEYHLALRPAAGSKEKQKKQ
jgi:hypothetical protein